VDDVQIGTAVCTLRQRLGWRQSDLGERADVSTSLVSLLESGQLVHVSIVALRRVFAALDARLDIRVRWRGGEIDRLLDRSHAAIVERVVQLLRDAGWDVRAEVSFSRYGDRGSIDVFAWNAALRAVLLIEVKSEIYSLEETLRRFHVKVRLAPEISIEQLGWRPRVVGSALVLPESSAARRRLAAHAYTVASAFPDRGRDVRLWLRQPDRALSAVWFLSDSGVVGVKQTPRWRIHVKPTPLPPDSDVIGKRRPKGPTAASADRPAATATPVTPMTVETDNRTELARAGFVLLDPDEDRGA
jgi:transcriptional regulator with XRE-family HTH domain